MNKTGLMMRIDPLLVGILSLVLASGLAVHALQANAYPNSETVSKNAKIFLSIDGYLADTVFVCGRSSIEWSNPYFNGSRYVMQMSVTDLELEGKIQEPYGHVSICLNPALSSGGQATSIYPSGMFPANSVVDYHLIVFLPGIFPGDTLTASTLHVTSQIEQMLPYFEPYSKEGTGAMMLMSNTSGPVGQITAWEEDALEYTRPEAVIVTPVPRAMNPRYSLGGDTLGVRTGVAGSLSPAAVSFLIREAGSVYPFQQFWTDTNGFGPSASTVWASPPGDGWSGCLDISSYPDTGGWFEIETVCSVPSIGQLKDTTTMFIDPTPCMPEITSITADSISFVQMGSIVPIRVQITAEEPESIRVWVSPIANEFRRSLTPINQHLIRFVTCNGLATAQACVPTAAAMCLDYFARNGYDQLNHPEGDTQRPEQTPQQTARQLGESMGTSSSEGTSTGAATAGIGSYLTSHGASGWDVEFKEMEASGLEELAKDFAADSEDVLLWLEDTTAGGQAAYHVATMDYLKTENVLIQRGEFQCYTTRTTIGFVDPNGGYEEEHVIQRGSGGMETQGYGFQPQGGDATIHGWTKVSPPAEDKQRLTLNGGRNWSDAGPVNGDAPHFAAVAPPGGAAWTIVAKGPASGNGDEDTLFWDTSGFDEGFYLLLVSADDPHGPSGYDLRLCSLADTSVAGVSGSQSSHPGLFLGAFPNPFASQVEIRFALARSCDVELEIYDVAGRRVRQLYKSQILRPGVESVFWDGNEENGTRASSGVYFCRLRASGKETTCSLILLR